MGHLCQQLQSRSSRPTASIQVIKINSFNQDHQNQKVQFRQIGSIKVNKPRIVNKIQLCLSLCPYVPMPPACCHHKNGRFIESHVGLSAQVCHLTISTRESTFRQVMHFRPLLRQPTTTMGRASVSSKYCLTILHLPVQESTRELVFNSLQWFDVLEAILRYSNQVVKKVQFGNISQCRSSLYDVLFLAPLSVFPTCHEKSLC